MYFNNLNPQLGRLFLILCLLVASNYSSAQTLLGFIDKCDNCKGKIKRIVTKQKADSDNYRSPLVKRTDEYNENERLVKTEIALDGYISKTIFYHYKDSLLIYELHQQPSEEDFYLVYQYYKKKTPRRIIKVDLQRMIINYAVLEYTKDLQPVYLKFYNVLGELLEKQNVEYYSSNQVVIRSFYPKSQLSNLQKYELLCKFNQPEKLRKRDFRDVITRPINLEVENNTLRIVKAVQTQTRERVQVEEVSYDKNGNWLSKKTFELKNNKNKRRLIKEIKREVEYYD